MSKRINQVQPRTEPLIYFCRVAAAPVLPRHVYWLKNKGQRQNIQVRPTVVGRP